MMTTYIHSGSRIHQTLYGNTTSVENSIRKNKSTLSAEDVKKHIETFEGHHVTFASIDSVPKALKLLEALQSEREINLKIEREGQPIEFIYFID